GREPRKPELRPIADRQLELARSLPTGQEPADRRDLEGPPREPRGREPPGPRDRPIERPMARPGARLRKIQDGNGQLSARLPGDAEQPGKLRRMEAVSCRAERDHQAIGDIRQAPSQTATLEPESALIEPKGHRDMETGPGEPTGRRYPGIRDWPLD